MTLFESLLKKVDTMLKVNAYIRLKDILTDQLIECLHKVPVKDTVSTHLKTLLSICKENEPEYNKIQAAVYPEIKCNIDLKAIKQNVPIANVPNKDDLKLVTNVDNVPKESCNDDLKSMQLKSNNSNFTAPNSKAKELRKKEPNIVSTVMENGEEYVIVKSNWKFNPKKLTENQKEKLKKKREDIPALYQDLSQSQDESKITAWKVDSQDLSTSTSKSASKSASEDVSTILKNMPSSEVVPTIMETIFSDTTKETIQKQGGKIINDDSPKRPPPVPAVKDPNTPRLALKDRVFRNVRNLMEKSGFRNENEITIEANKTITEINRTPNAKTSVSASMVNSAPSKIHYKRSSRVIKTPKKFEDSKALTSKQTRRSQTNSQSTSQTDTPSVSLKSPGLREAQLDRTEIIIDLENTNNNEIMPIDPTTSNENKRNTVEKQLLSDTPMNAIETVQILERNQQKTKQTCSIDKSGDKLDINTNVPEIDTTISHEHQVKNQDDVKVDSSKKKLTPKCTRKTKQGNQSSGNKKTSRIEKQLMIDMVQGNILLQAPKGERCSRKKMSSSGKVIKKRRLPEKMSRIGFKSARKTEMKTKEKIKSSTSAIEPLPTSVIVVESQDKLPRSSDELPASEDIIESSQDSSIPTISVKSTKNSSKKIPIVKINRSREMESLLNSSESKRLFKDSNIQITDTTPPQPENLIVLPPINNNPCMAVDPSNVTAEYRKMCATQKIRDDFNNVTMVNDSVTSQHEIDDISLPKNKTMLEEEKTEIELTENMDTQPFEDKSECSDVITGNNHHTPIEIVYTEELPLDGPETQEIAEVDTEPINLDSQLLNSTQDKLIDAEIENEMLKRDKEEVTKMTEKRLTPTMFEAAEAPLTNLVEPNNACSPLQDATQKKKDFLNDTIEISPIKTLSPVREEKLLSPETSANYVVIKLTSPVQSNGEPFNEKYDSPEIFTEEKVYPDKRDQSPPRIEVPVANTSPSTSLSLKKNRLQMRSSGRAAQMLGLCAPDKLEAIMNSDKSVESEETKKSSTSISTPARRNLRILYNSVGDSDYNEDNDNQVNESDQEENASFLKFKRMLPSANSSPAGPILKRKLVDITDETTVSPASKVITCNFLISISFLIINLYISLVGPDCKTSA